MRPGRRCATFGVSSAFIRVCSQGERNVLQVRFTELGMGMGMPQPAELSSMDPDCSDNGGDPIMSMSDFGN